MRSIRASTVVLALLVGACGGEVTDSAPVEEPVITTAIEESASTGEAVEAPAETMDAKVVFDGDMCTYRGPAVVPAGSEMMFEFDDSAHPAALVVLLIEEGTSWDQVLQDTGPGTARMAPEWVVHYWVQIESGSLVRTMDQGEYLVTCNTAPDDTDAVHPAALIQVIDG